MYSIGLIVLCVYSGVFTINPTGYEYMDNIPAQCKIVDMSETFDDISPGYTHLKIDCTEDLKQWKLAENQLNWKIGWTNTDSCYIVPTDSNIRMPASIEE